MLPTVSSAVRFARLESAVRFARLRVSREQGRMGLGGMTTSAKSIRVPTIQNARSSAVAHGGDDTSDRCAMCPLVILSMSAINKPDSLYVCEIARPIFFTGSRAPLRSNSISPVLPALPVFLRNPLSHNRASVTVCRNEVQTGRSQLEKMKKLCADQDSTITCKHCV